MYQLKLGYILGCPDALDVWWAGEDILLLFSFLFMIN